MEEPLFKQRLEKAIINFNFKSADVLIDEYFSQGLQVFDDGELEKFFSVMVKQQSLEGIKWLLKRGFKTQTSHFEQILSNREWKVKGWFAWLFNNNEAFRSQMDSGTLVSFMMDINSIEKFIKAFEEEDSETISSLLKETDFDINARYKEGHTLLTRAISSKNKKFKDFLLKQDRIDVNRASADGTTPLMWAILAHDLEAVKTLVGLKNLDMEARNQKQETALSLVDQVKDPSLKQKMKAILKGITCRHSFELQP